MIVQDKDFLTIEQAAKIAQVPSDQIIDWTRNGLPYLRIHEMIRIEKENLFEWLLYDDKAEG